MTHCISLRLIRYDINISTWQDIWLILMRYMHERFSCASGRSYSTNVHSLLLSCHLTVAETWLPSNLGDSVAQVVQVSRKNTSLPNSLNRWRLTKSSPEVVPLQLLEALKLMQLFLCLPQCQTLDLISKTCCLEGAQRCWRIYKGCVCMYINIYVYIYIFDIWYEMVCMCTQYVCVWCM